MVSTKKSQFEESAGRIPFHQQVFYASQGEPKNALHLCCHGQVEHIMKQYDVVHIHGCSSITDAVIKACKRQNIPFLVTLHGLNSFEKLIKLHSSLCRYERDF